jgi:hypothetical protein
METHAQNLQQVHTCARQADKGAAQTWKPFPFHCGRVAVGTVAVCELRAKPQGAHVSVNDVAGAQQKKASA